jgi:hypothetical protein
MMVITRWGDRKYLRIVVEHPHMKKLLLPAVITFAPFILSAYASNLTGDALALACEGNVPNMKKEKMSMSSFAMGILTGGTTQDSPSFRGQQLFVLPALQSKR